MFLYEKKLLQLFYFRARLVLKQFNDKNQLIYFDNPAICFAPHSIGFFYRLKPSWIRAYRTYIHSSTYLGKATFEKKNTLEFVLLKKHTRTSGGIGLTTKSVKFSRFCYALFSAFMLVGMERFERVAIR